MINKRYTATLKTLMGNEYLINIKPADSNSPSPRTFNTSSDGFSLSYKGANNTYLDPIRASQVTVVAIVEDSEFAEFVDDIASEQEQTYAIEILKKQQTGSLYDPFWSGYIWPENIQQSYGSYPYTVSLRAADAFGRLKDLTGVQYNFNSVWGLVQQLFAAYSPSGSLDQSENIIPPSATTGEARLLRLVNAIDFTDRPFYNISVNLLSEMNTQASLADGQGNINTFSNRLQLIKDLLRMWGFRIWIDGGYFYVFDYGAQMSLPQDGAGTFRMIEHNSNGEPTESVSLVNIRFVANNENKILDGGRFYYKQGYGRTISEFKIDSIGTSDSQTLEFNGNQRNVKSLQVNFGSLWQIGAEITNPQNQTPVDITNIMSDSVSGVNGTLIDIAQARHDNFFFNPQKYFNGSIRSKKITFTHVLEIKTEIYVPNSLTLIASKDEWSGEWVKAYDLDENILTSQTSNEFLQNQADELLKTY